MINRVTLLGNLGADPELRVTQSGTQIANLRVATSESWKDKNTGEKQERTEWHRVSIFGPLAEIAGKYLRKGSKVYLEGQLRTRKWQDQSGQDRYSTEVVLQGPASAMKMLDGRQDGAGQGGAPRAPQGDGLEALDANGPGGGDFDDDIPFAAYLAGAEVLA